MRPSGERTQVFALCVTVRADTDAMAPWFAPHHGPVHHHIKGHMLVPVHRRARTVRNASRITAFTPDRSSGS